MLYLFNFVAISKFSCLAYSYDMVHYIITCEPARQLRAATAWHASGWPRSFSLKAWSYGVKCDTDIRFCTLTWRPVRGRKRMSVVILRYFYMGRKTHVPHERHIPTDWICTWYCLSSHPHYSENGHISRNQYRYP